MKSIDRKWKKLFAIVIAAAMLLTIGSVTTYRLVEASAFDSARAAAREKVPASAELIKESKDDDEYSFEFYENTVAETYSVSVERKDRTQIQVKSKIESQQGSENINLTKQDVIDIIETQFPDAQISSISLSEDDDFYIYEVVFSAEAARGQFWIDPETGKVIERVLRYGQPLLIMNLGDDDYVDQDDSNDVNDDTIAVKTDRYISLEEARVIALEQHPDMQLKGAKYDEDDDKLIIKIELANNSEEIEVKIDASTGAILETDYDDDDDSDDNKTTETTVRLTESDAISEATETNDGDDSTSETNENITTEATEPTVPTLIGKERVMQIVLSKVPAAVISEIELDRDDGRTYYEGEAYDNSYEYDFEIDAFTGAIIDWEIDDRDDDDDDINIDDDDGDDDDDDDDDGDDDDNDDDDDDDDDDDN